MVGKGGPARTVPARSWWANPGGYSSQRIQELGIPLMVGNLGLPATTGVASLPMDSVLCMLSPSWGAVP